MKRLLVKAWPLMAVIVLATTLALQIPRKALFFKPVSLSDPKSFASFVSYDAVAYETVVQKARMSWQMRGIRGTTFESHVDAFDFSDDTPPLTPLELPAEFSVTRVSGTVPAVPVSLLPPSLAYASAPVALAVPPPDDGDARRVRAELLEIPESLQSTE